MTKGTKKYLAKQVELPLRGEKRKAKRKGGRPPGDYQIAQYWLNRTTLAMVDSFAVTHGLTTDELLFGAMLMFADQAFAWLYFANAKSVPHLKGKGL